MLLAVGFGLLAVVWWSSTQLSSRVARAAEVQTTTFTVSETSLLVSNPFATDTQGGSWTLILPNGNNVVESFPPPRFVATSFTAYGNGFTAGENVTLQFITQPVPAGAACKSSSAGQVVKVMTSKIVDQYSGALFMSGDFSGNGWAPGECGYVAFLPDAAGAYPPITVTLAGYASQN
jgi:hypothetical protein